MAEHNLPTTRHLITHLISSVASPTTEPAANPLKDASDRTKNIFLTLHVLFPNEFLPALDLLDRGLVTRLCMPSAETAARPVGPAGTNITEASSSQPLQQLMEQTSVYYVRSAQQQHTARSTSRYRPAASEITTSYEVRLAAWSCSCPAFAFSAFPAGPSENKSRFKGSITRGDELGDPGESGGTGWQFGGQTLGTDLPVCKHLLACVLVEHCGMFAGFVEERVVSVEEMAGWAAGWGG